MADQQFIRYTIEDRVATLVIDHPPANALNKQTVTELDGAMDELLAYLTANCCQGAQCLPKTAARATPKKRQRNASSR